MWKLVCFVAILAAHSILVKCDQIYVRSHGEVAPPEAEPVIADKTFETVLGLKVVQPKRRLRVRTRVPKKDPTTTEAIQAAKAAALVARDLHQQQKNPSYRDLEPIESSHVPVSYSKAQ